VYDGPIIDAHHHMWDLSMGKHPWLTPADGSVDALGSLEPLRRTYVVEDYLRDAAGHDVVATVHIEALWDRGSDPVDETRWLETLDKSAGVATRYVAFAPLIDPDVEPVLEAQAAFERVVGIRDILSWHPDPTLCFAPRGDLIDDPDWRRGFALLERYGLGFDLMIYPYQAEQAARLAADFPAVSFLVNHCGSPVDRDDEGMARWRTGLQLLGAQPNVAIKISNLGAYDPQWTYDSLRDVTLWCIECFGPGRSLFATDYPVARMQMTYDEVYGTFKRIAEAFTPAEQRAMFHDNARRAYRFD
jgi:predicted TIM-barrel fold metal-dependent hydrolase